MSKRAYRFWPSCSPHIPPGRPSRGIALLTALLALSLVSLIGLTMMFVSTTKVLIERDDQAWVFNSYSAESGCEEARERIESFLSNPLTPLTDPNQVIYVVSANSVNPAGGTAESNPYFDSEFGSGSAATLVPSNLNRPGFAWVRIARKTERWARYNLDGSSPYLSSSNTNVDVPVLYGFSKLASPAGPAQYVNSGAHPVSHTGTPVYHVIAFVRDRAGFKLSTRSDISRVPVPPLRAAFYSKDSISISTANTTVTGEDESGTSVALDSLESRNAITGDLTNVIGAPTSVRPYSPFIYDLEAIIEMLRPPVSREIEKVSPGITKQSDGTYRGDGLNFGEIPLEGDQSQAVFADGPLILSNSMGQGILIVNGDLSVSGTLSFYGLIIVRGKVILNGEGASGIEIHGGILSSSDVGDQTSILSGRISIRYHYALIQEQFNTLGFIRLAYRNAL